jgi:hypothetical protein
MDQNKLKVLQNVEYKVKRVCGNCMYADLTPSTDWGTCTYHDYHHLKHNERRQLSIHRTGSCRTHRLVDLSVIHGFAQFLEP